MATPPNKCLRGIVRIPAAAAANFATNIDVPVAVFIYASVMGIKPEVSYQKANGDWVEISKPSTTPGIYEHPMAMLPGEAAAEAAIINEIGVKAWNVQKFQQWVSDNLYAFFKPLVGAAVPSPTGEVTKDNIIDAVNASLADHFIFLDTNGDGVPEFHGK